MKTYIIIASAIGNMGGGQMYVNNKVKYLRENGWEVTVFFQFASGQILIDDLKEFADNCIPEMQFGFYYVPKCRKKQIVQFIKQRINNYCNIVVETHSLMLSYWGELLSKELGATHIINCIEEQFPPLNHAQFEFLMFKMKRWEILNFGVKTQKRLFKEKWDESFLQYRNDISFKCSNVTSEIDTDIEFAKSDYTIITIGRLSKPYIPGLVDSLCNFANKHLDKTINVVFVGGSTDGSIEKTIQKQFSYLSNVNVYMLGYLFPVPLSIIQKSNAAVATANSILVTADQDIPTISLDINDYKAIGVYGYTTSNKFIRNIDEPVIEVEDLLEDILINKQFLRHNAICNSMIDSNQEFEKQMNFLEKSASMTKQYFCVDSTISNATRIISVIKWNLIMLRKRIHYIGL